MFDYKIILLGCPFSIYAQGRPFWKLIANLVQMSFGIKDTGVEVGAGILALLAWLACWFGCSIVRELLGVRCCVLGLCNV